MSSIDGTTTKNNELLSSPPPVTEYQSYQYVGGFTDVLKHVVFCSCIKELQKQHPSITIVDAFSGEGAYDLHDCSKNLSIQYQWGIGPVLRMYDSSPETIPIPVKEFIELLYQCTGCTSHENVDVYPGSPIYGQHLLRTNKNSNKQQHHDNDQHIVLDYYLDHVEWLQNSNSFQQLNSFDLSTIKEVIVPQQQQPNENQKENENNKQTSHRIILLDPPYETNEDYTQTKQLLDTILTIDPYVTVLVFIPFITNHPRFRFTYPKSLRDIAKEKAKTGRYYCSINVTGTTTTSTSTNSKKDAASAAVVPIANGCGILICNPPPTFDSILSNETVHWLATTMNQGKDEYTVEQIMKKKKTKE